MIVVKITGGLGNQMFQYSAGRRLSVISKTPLCFDTSWFDSDHPSTVKRNFELNLFSIVGQTATKSEIFKFKGLRGSFPELVLANRFPQIHKTLFSNKSVFFLENQKYNFETEIFNPVSDRYLEGYWQSEKYFSDISEVIRKDFTFNLPPNRKNAEFIQKIQSSSSVSLHIRRTDFITDPVTKEFHGLCDLNYYQKALKTLKKYEKKPCIFIFSDDISWAKQNLKTDLQTIFVDFNTGSKNFEDLRLMSHCKHNIIANSSFSWWGAWLNDNSKKIVIAPKKWFNNNTINGSNIIPDNWMKI